MGQELTTDRVHIPALGTDLIQASHFQLTKISTPLVAAVLAVLTGVLPNTGLGTIPKFNQLDKSQQGLAILGILLVIGLSILGLSLVWSSDIKARAQATAANLALRALPPVVAVAAPAGLPGQSIGLWVTIKATGLDDEYLVVAARDLGGRNEYLLAKGNDVPIWIADSEVVTYKVSAAH